MEYLNWELSVLSRAVAYSNLSGAAAQIGVSQPQLSRIIARLEADLAIQLLDRDAKRKSGWTPTAFKLAEIYSKAFKAFTGDVLKIADDSRPTHVRVGTLDGLVDLAMKFCQVLLALPRTHIVELKVYDLSVLEEFFMKGDLDFAFTSREPGAKKHRFVQTLGYQTLTETKTKGDVKVLSPFEYATTHHDLVHDAKDKILISNSLVVRKRWIEEFGGTATLPSDVRARKSPKEDEIPVLLLGQDTMNKKLWDDVRSAYSLNQKAK